MHDYYLVIDTESSGLPIKWNASCEQLDNWPFVVQVCWLVYNHDGALLKQEDHYIANTDYTVHPASREIHGISDEILSQKGKERHAVLELLQKDLEQFQPIVVGHFVELDYKLLNVEFFRIGQKESPLEKLPLFCTMNCGASLPYMETQRQLKLVDLYHYLFSENQPFPHNAQYDALATARCFFKEKEILSMTQRDILSQKPVVENIQYHRNTRKLGFAVVAAALFILVLILYNSFHQ